MTREELKENYKKEFQNKERTKRECQRKSFIIDCLEKRNRLLLKEDFTVREGQRKGFRTE